MPSDPRLYCTTCRRPLDLEKKSGRRDECPHCSAELHACLNCRSYEPRLSRPCREPQALVEETIRDVARANFCQWFEHRPGPPGLDGPSSPGEAKAAFDALFGGPKPAADGEKDEAAVAFEKLFKR